MGTRKGGGKGKRKVTSSKKKMPAKGTGRARGEPYVKFSDRLTASLEEINRVIQDNKATIDAIQDIALELVRAAGALEEIASKYAKMVDSALQTAIPILSNIPLVSDTVMGVVKEIQEFAQNILDVCTTAERVIPNVEAGLVNADIAKLKANTGDLQKMTESVRKVIPAV